MREKRDFKLRRPTGRTLTPEKLMGILKSVETDKVAKEKYKELTGLNPPPEVGELVYERKVSQEIAAAYAKKLEDKHD